MNELRISQQNAWQELQVLFKPVIREQVAGGDFIQAYLIQAKLPHLQSIRFELPVKVARQAYSSHLWDAHLIEVRGDNCFLTATEEIQLSGCLGIGSNITKMTQLWLQT